MKKRKSWVPKEECYHEETDKLSSALYNKIFEFSLLISIILTIYTARLDDSGTTKHLKPFIVDRLIRFWLLQNCEDGIQRQLCTKNSFSLCSNLMTPLPQTVPLLIPKVVTNKQNVLSHFPLSLLAFFKSWLECFL